MKLCSCLFFGEKKILENEERNFYPEIKDKINPSFLTIESDDSILHTYKPNTHFPTIEEVDENSISSLGSNGNSLSSFNDYKNSKTKNIKKSSDELKIEEDSDSHITSHILDYNNYNTNKVYDKYKAIPTRRWSYYKLKKTNSF